MLKTDFKKIYSLNDLFQRTKTLVLFTIKSLTTQFFRGKEKFREGIEVIQKEIRKKLAAKWTGSTQEKMEAKNKAIREMKVNLEESEYR